jgi:hypothetical protein
VNPWYPAVADRAGNRCEYCLAPEAFFNFSFEVEHILPRAEGGTNTRENLALACGSCNRYKSHFRTGYDVEEETTTALFDPRRSVWADHFAFDPETFQLTGRTATGRAIITRLHMNSDFQIRARRLWSQSGLYP